MFSNNRLIFIYILFAIIAVFALIEYMEMKKNDVFIAQNYQKRLDILEQLKKFNLENIPLEKINNLDHLKIYNLNLGLKEMKKHKLVIAGIARDNLIDLPITLKHIYQIANLFADYRIIIFENDSTDGTKIAFNIWKEKDAKVKIISEDFNKIKRINHQFMADIRNKYLSALKSPEYENYDLLMLLDFDMSYGIDIRGIQDSFAQINKWDAICSNGIANSKGQMYDMFAFRNEEFPFSPKKWHEICKNNELPYSNKCEIGKKDYSKGILYELFAFKAGWQKDSRLFWLHILPQGQKIYQAGEALIPVSSCFGGLAFYKKNFIQDCAYESQDDDCEHVHFHQCLQNNNARIMMNPSQIIRYSHYKEK